MTTTRIHFSNIFLIFLLAVTTYSCSVDADLQMNPENGEAVDEQSEAEEDSTTQEETNNETSSCSNPADFVFNEKDGLVLVEFENTEFTADWSLKSDGDSHSGAGYMVWEGPQHLSNPGNGAATFKINIANPGTYQFIWRSAVKMGTSGSDHNDTWLRFNDANDFYGQNGEGTSTVYPKDTGKTPNPEGATKEGWFKIYRSGNDLDFKWQSKTFDNNGHDIFVVFENPGTYLMEISARSSGHGIDKFALFNDAMTTTDAINSKVLSAITCD